ncbi:hypothetical protein MEC_01256 [Bartonella alsatica IBS 382]|uniref:Uncharacterized protein n=1 Tax=Bartonella alsatica IBS 382 TaxID=1094551 RepID=J1IT39_9HYPH|nr:hypothetical protein MEC_01256 [Bartonella alsatica IBS 382]
MKTCRSYKLFLPSKSDHRQCFQRIDRKFAAFRTYFGLAFQLTDDLLDITASTKVLGKTAGEDETAQKATFVRLYGIEETRKKRNELIAKAEALLYPFGVKAKPLQQAARFNATRKN